ncbi:MAG: CRISPR-associated protein Cas5 [bacterium]
MKGLHVRFEGFSAFFRLPFIVTGTQLSSPVPPYSTLLGLISCCAGRDIGPSDTRIGYEYKIRGTTLELERTDRLKMDNKGRLKLNSKGQGISYREIHIAPILDLYLTNPNLKVIFERPVGTPCLGRSQDIVWIKLIEEIDLEGKKEGMVGATLLPFPQKDFGGRIIRLSDYFNNSKYGVLRKLEKLGIYQAVPQVENGVYVTTKNLFHPAGIPDKEKVVYIHDWSN